MKSAAKERLARWRSWLGYILFIAAIAYALYTHPVNAWQLDIYWLATLIPVFLLMFVLQVAQFLIFVKHHGKPQDWSLPMLFTARKALLNTVLPVKSGTVALLYMVTRQYQLRWHDYLRFVVVASIISLLVSMIAVMCVINLMVAFIMLLCTFGVSYIAAKRSPGYLKQAMPLLINAALMFISMLAGIFLALQSIGADISFIASTYAAIVLNTLAQLSLTPGNIGIREAALGMLSPHLAISPSVAIMASAVFFVIRTAVYATLWLVIERREVPIESNGKASQKSSEDAH